ncbi:hypothetical protein Bca4012_030664 [Brassica carinata]
MQTMKKNHEMDFEATKVIKQDRMFFYLTFYKKQIKLETRCFIVDAIETLEKLKPELTVLERSLFEERILNSDIFAT